MANHDEPNVGLTAVIGIAGAALLFVIIVLLQAGFYHAEEQETLRKATAAGNEELLQLRSQHLEQLNGYRWIDQKAGIVAIPIDRAMELIADGQVKATANPGIATAPAARRAKPSGGSPGSAGR